MGILAWPWESWAIRHENYNESLINIDLRQATADFEESTYDVRRDMILLDGRRFRLFLDGLALIPDDEALAISTIQLFRVHFVHLSCVPQLFRVGTEL